MNFNIYNPIKKKNIIKLLTGKLNNTKYNGINGISNVGNNFNWTGNDLAQANLFCYGKLSFNPNLNIKNLLNEWIILSFNKNYHVVNNIKTIMKNSWYNYENYTSPLGLNGMYDNKTHYGPNIDDSEYNSNGLYHNSNNKSLGINRYKQKKSCIHQYSKYNRKIFSNHITCPEKFLLFFHNLPYNYILKSKKTIIQHIYDVHFSGVKTILINIYLWNKLKKHISFKIFDNVKKRLKKQYINACEWRDQINSYFYKKSGIKDKFNRKIY